jgi:hypothetical protein
MSSVFSNIVSSSLYFFRASPGERPVYSGGFGLGTAVVAFEFEVV